VDSTNSNKTALEIIPEWIAAFQSITCFSFVLVLAINYFPYRYTIFNMKYNKHKFNQEDS
jgi:hypothetical protein